MQAVNEAKQWQQATPEEQVAVEQRMRNEGIQRSRRRLRKAQEKGLESSTSPGQGLLKAAIPELHKALEEWAQELRDQAGRPGRNHGLHSIFNELDLEQAAAVSVQFIIDSISQKRSRTDVACGLGQALEDEARYKALKSSDPGLYRLAEQRTAGYSSPKVVRRHVVNLMNGIGHEFSPWSPQNKLRLGIAMIEKLEEATGLIRQIELSKPFAKKGEKQLYIVPSDGTLNWLDHAHLREELLRPFYHPCVVPPVDWISPSSGGYHTRVGRVRPLVKARHRVQIRALEDAAAPRVYEAINRLQRTPWKVNSRVLEVMAHYWDAGLEVAGLPSKFEIPEPPKPADIATNDAAKEAWKAHAAWIHEENHRQKTTRTRFAALLGEAKHYLETVFYYVYQVDWRGRAYPLSTTLHPQGCDWEKALLLFGEGAPIKSPEAWDWHRIHGANCWGIDKVPFAERIEFIESRQADWVAVAADPYSNKAWEDADEPWQFLAWCFDYAACLANESHFSHLPIHQDATQSGIQIMSLLTRDQEGGENTNCTPSDSLRDLYGDVAARLNENLEQCEGDRFREWLDLGIDRSATKSPVMTRVYNSREWRCALQLVEWRLAKTPLNKNYRSNLKKEAYALAREVRRATDEVGPGMRACQKWLGEVAKIASDIGKDLRWTSPTGFPVLQRYRKEESETVTVRLHSKIRSSRKVRMFSETEELDRDKSINAFAPNFIHSLDAAAMMAVVNHGASQGLCSFAVVHDSFASLAADADQLAKSIREAFISIFSDDVLARLRDEIQEQLGPRVSLPPLPEYGSLKVEGLRDAPYFFC